jgi:hypothetical protein
MDKTCRRCGGCPDVRCTSPWPMQMQIAPAGFLEGHRLCSCCVIQGAFTALWPIHYVVLCSAVPLHAARRTPHYMSLYPTFELDFR